MGSKLQVRVNTDYSVPWQQGGQLKLGGANASTADNDGASAEPQQEPSAQPKPEVDLFIHTLRVSE